MSEQPKRMTAEEMVAERAYDPEICQVFTDERRQVNAYHARVIAKSYAKQEVAEVSRKLDKARKRITSLERKLAETYASRSSLDCSFAGPYIEPDAGTKSHCPPNRPCQRCTLEKEREALVDATRERDKARAELERLREALTPSGATKAAYIGEVTEPDATRTAGKRTVSWTAIKDTMALIRQRAELKAADGGEGRS